jgi:hypothetical protein
LIFPSGTLDVRAVLTDEQQQARWAQVLPSVPLLQRLELCRGASLSLLAVLPTHLPQLVFLKLITSMSAEELMTRLAHPTVQKLEVDLTDELLGEAHRQRLLCSPQLPQLTSCTSSY